MACEAIQLVIFLGVIVCTLRFSKEDSDFVLRTLCAFCLSGSHAEERRCMKDDNPRTEHKGGYDTVFLRLRMKRMA